MQSCMQNVALFWTLLSRNTFVFNRKLLWSHWSIKTGVGPTDLRNNLCEFVIICTFYVHRKRVKSVMRNKMHDFIRKLIVWPIVRFTEWNDQILQLLTTTPGQWWWSRPLHRIITPIIMSRFTGKQSHLCRVKNKRVTSLLLCPLCVLFEDRMRPRMLQHFGQ